MALNERRLHRVILACAAAAAVALVAGLTQLHAGGQFGGGVSYRPPTPATRGVLTNGRYHHNRTGIEIAVPQGWTFMGDGASSDNGDGVRLLDYITGGIVNVWMINRSDSLEQSRSAGIDDEYKHVIGMKIRMRFDQGMKNYWVPSDTIQERYVSERKALTAIGEYSDRNEVRFLERLAWIHTPDRRAFFYGTVPADDMPLFKDRFDSILDSARVN